MDKQFKDLQVGDTVYRVNFNNREYIEYTVENIRYVENPSKTVFHLNNSSTGKKYALYISKSKLRDEYTKTKEGFFAADKQGVVVLAFSESAFVKELNYKFIDNNE